MPDLALEINLKGITDRIAHPFPALREPVLEQVRATFALIFASGGSYGGVGSWEQLSPATIARKSGYSYRILVDEGTLEESLVDPSSAWGYARQVDDTSLAVGTNVPYAEFHQFGTINMPARRIMPDTWPEEDQQRLLELVSNYIIS